MNWSALFYTTAFLLILHSNQTFAQPLCLVGGDTPGSLPQPVFCEPKPAKSFHQFSKLKQCIAISTVYNKDRMAMQLARALAEALEPTDAAVFAKSAAALEQSMKAMKALEVRQHCQDLAY